MPSLLVVEVSPRFGDSTSRMLTDRFVLEWRTAQMHGHVVYRDLARTPPPFVDRAWIDGAAVAFDRRAPESVAAIAVSDVLTAELVRADHLVIGTPMYNFAVPAALKAWIDHVVRVGATVSPDGVGLLTGKRATVILATGDDYRPGSPAARHDHASGYLRHVLGWIGIIDVDVIFADRARAGERGERAVACFGAAIRAAVGGDGDNRTAW